jgi:hypothetical protein
MISVNSGNLADNWNSLIIELNPTKFEELCYDLINAMNEYKNIIWRRGGADSGRDLEATLIRKNPDGITESSEKWFFECKKYSVGLNVSDISSKVHWAINQRADYLAFMSNSYLTNQCRDFCKGEMDRSTLKILEWTDVVFRDILFRYPGICEQYFHLLPPRQNWKEPSLKENAKKKIGRIEFGNVSEEEAIRMITDAYHIIQEMQLVNEPKENVELFEIEKEVIRLANEKEKEFFEKFKINVPNPDFYFELALANYYMGTNEESKKYFKKFLEQIEMLYNFKRGELDEDFELDYGHIKFLYEMRKQALSIFEKLEGYSSDLSVYNLAKNAEKKTVEFKSLFQWIDWDGDSITCLDLINSGLPIEIFTTEETNTKLKERVFAATIYYTYINDFMAHIRLKEIHEII